MINKLSKDGMKRFNHRIVIAISFPTHSWVIWYFFSVVGNRENHIGFHDLNDGEVSLEVVRIGRHNSTSDNQIY